MGEQLQTNKSESIEAQWDQKSNVLQKTKKELEELMQSNKLLEE